MKTALETITPDKAKAWLEPLINRNNRPLRPSHVAEFVRAILDGKWRITHQGIAFDHTGRLIDGQHRLSAIVLANKAVQMQVSRELEDDVFGVLDCGARRAHFDRVHLVNDPTDNKTLCQMLHRFIKDALRVKYPQVSEIEDEFLKRAESWMWTAKQFRPRKRQLGHAAVLAALSIYHALYPTKAGQFCEGYLSGANLSEGSPVLKLHQHMLGTGFADGGTYWLAVSAMRAHLKSKSLTRLYEATEDMMGNESGRGAAKAKHAAISKGNLGRSARRASA